jgi:hypothetical protein
MQHAHLQVSSQPSPLVSTGNRFGAHKIAGHATQPSTHPSPFVSAAFSPGLQVGKYGGHAMALQLS